MSMTSLPKKLPPVASRPASPTSTPADLPKQEGLTRSSSQRSQVEGSGLPKSLTRSRTGSLGSQASVKSARRPDGDATSKLAALHGGAKSETVDGESPVPLESAPLSAADKQKGVDRTPQSPAIIHSRNSADDITPKDVEDARKKFLSEIDHEAIDKGWSEAKQQGKSDQEIATRILNDTLRSDEHEGSATHDAASTHDALPAGAASEGWVAKGKKILVSAGNVTARNTLSVGIPTFARQFISYGFEAAFDKTHANDATKAAMGTLFGLAPALAAHAYGAYRDEKAGTATWVSRRSRAIMAATALAATAYELKAGAAPDNASLHMAFTAYTAMRDLLVQSNIRLDNPNTEGLESDWTRWGAMMVGYGLDQGLVNLAMSKLASPSGPGAYRAGTGWKDQFQNAGVRAVINLIGEIGEDLMFQSIPALRAKFFPGGVDQTPLAGRPEGSKVLADGTHTEPHTLELGIHSEGYKSGYLANGALGPWAVRTGILATTIALTGVTGKKLPEKFQEVTADFIVGGVNALLYEPFAEAGSGQPSPVRIADPESARSSEDPAHDTDLALTADHTPQDMQLRRRQAGSGEA